MSDKPANNNTQRTEGQSVNLGRTTPSPNNSLKPTSKPSSDK